MRLLFLDIDGVLNSEQWALERYNRHTVGSELAIYTVDPNSVDALNRIIDETGARVVVSSTWGKHLPLTKIERILNAAGFRHHLLGVTPEGGAERGDEIREWLDTLNGPVLEDRDIVILDDSSDMGKLAYRLFRTNYKTGLRACHVDEVVAMYGPGALS